MDQEPNTHEEKVVEKKSTWQFVKEFIQFIVIALIIVIPVRIYVIQPFIVQGESMDPTFKNNDYLIVDEISYRFHQPERGDVVILRYEYGYEITKPYFIKRVIALPGDTVSIDGQKVTITNAAHPNGFVLNEPYVEHLNFPDQKITMSLGKDEYFVMGDNRPASKDARIWSATGGPEALQAKDIIGRPLIRLWPFDTAGFFPGEYHQAATTTSQ